MKRRQLIGYAGVGLVTAVIANLGDQVPVNAQNSDVSIQWLGHTCFLLTTENVKILINPFNNLGCTAKYRPPIVKTDLVLISSQLLDEGAIDKIPGNPKLVYQPGVYEFRGVKFQGITTDHDRQGGKRFGKNVVWKLTSRGMNLLHLGGSAAPITLEQKILMGRPDVLFIPVADSDNCDITPVDNFLTLMQGVNIRRSNNDSVVVNSQSLPKNTEIQILSYKF